MRLVLYETHTVALEEQLEGTRITRKGDTSTQVAPPPLKVVAGGKQCATRSTITPTKTCSADIYRCIKRRVGHSIKRVHCKGNLVLSRKQVVYKPLGTKGGLSGSKRVPRPLFNNIVLVPQTTQQWLPISTRKGGMKSGSLCARLWRILIAHKLSRLGQTIQTEWSLHPEMFQAICSRWHQPHVDLFATRFNNKLPQFVSLVPDPQAWAVDALSLSWEDLDPYAFPPVAILGKVVEKLQDYPCNRIIDCTGVAQHALVLGSSGHVQSDPTVSAQSAQSGDSAIQPDPAQEPVKPEPTCLAPRATAI